MTSVARVHVITNDELFDSREFHAKLSDLAAIRGIAIHLRSRTQSARNLMECAAIVEEGRALLHINDRVDIALALDAVAVHLPESGLPVGPVRRWVGSRMLIGRSTHSTSDAAAARRDGADYVFLGPIWNTSSHPDRLPLGPVEFGKVADGVVAIGGIDRTRAKQCAQLGAHGVAVISEVWNASDPCNAAQGLLECFQ